MRKLTRVSEIWTLEPTKEDLLVGAEYASIALPWTFNRMQNNTGSAGQQGRALNLAKGLVAQEVLSRALREKGVSSQVDRKSYRDSDLFDFKLLTNHVEHGLDLKTLNVYTDYRNTGRSPFTPELVMEHAGYSGPDWRTFFPMLIPHTQIRQNKEAYCFAIAASTDFRANRRATVNGALLAAFPHGDWLPFLSNKRLCEAREAVNQGITLQMEWLADLFGEAIEMTVVGEWAGEPKKQSVELVPHRGVTIGPFSAVSSFRVEEAHLNALASGHVRVSIAVNSFTGRCDNATRRNVNVIPSETFVLGSNDFVNLLLPDDYTLHFIGWTYKQAFIDACRTYTGWVWPNDNINPHLNQPFIRVTDRDKEDITKAGFGDCIVKDAPLKLGWLKTTGQGSGTYCYYYPNLGRGGGIRESNLYILPKDLYVMDDLGAIS